MGHVTRVGETRNAYKILVRKSAGKRTQKVHNIKMDLREKRWEGEDWMHLAQDRDQWWAVVYTVTNLGVPYKAGNFLTS
jgi:hypothetical protein